MKVPVFHSYPSWQLSGVSTWSLNLMRSMKDSNFESQILLTGIAPSPHSELNALGVPYSFLDLPLKRSRRQERKSLKEFLGSRMPCIYVTNFDFHRSCAVGTLPPQVRVIMVVHSDEPCYFDELKRIGGNCDAIVCVSTYLNNRVKADFPHLNDRVHYIPYGVSAQPLPPRQKPQGRPIKLCYCNRLQEYQKCIFDLPRITRSLTHLKVDFELHIAGDGPDRVALEKEFLNTEAGDRVHFLGRLRQSEVHRLMRESDLFLLTSKFEGLPISLLEAMSHGCVPIVYDIKSGIRDVITHGVNGFIIRQRDVEGFANQIAAITGKDYGKLTECSRKSRDHIASRFSLDRMASDYEQLFQNCLESPPLLRNGKLALPSELRLLGRIKRRLLQRRQPKL